MKLGVLFSGGKDSCAAIHLARQYSHNISCLLTLNSKNKESYMFHTPNIYLVELQGEAMGVPVVVKETEGVKEEELEDLKELIQEAIIKYKIEGVVTGAVASVYQATRIQKICHELGLWCFNPLWQRDPYEHIVELVQQGFEIFIGAIAAYPMEKEWLGKRIGKKELLELKELQDKHKINPSGEGGEFETFVTHGPGWKQKIVIKDAKTEYDTHAGVWEIGEVKLEEKEYTPKKVIHQPTQGNVLLISTCEEKLSELEFVQPIARILNDDCLIVHYKKKEIIEQELNNHSHIIICGTALEDDKFLDHIELFDWIKRTKKPLLGICSGHQILGLVEGKELEENVEIGMKTIPLFDKEYDVYLLHHNNIKEFDYFFKKENKESILFHPEVRNECFIEYFMKH